VLDSLHAHYALLGLHREAEIQGLRLVFALMRKLSDTDAQIELARQAADEARHLWMLERRLAELRATLSFPARQPMTLRPLAIGKDSGDTLAAACALKQRALLRYTASLPGLDREAAELREAIAADEKTHLAWFARRLARARPSPDCSPRIERFLEAEDAAFAAVSGA